MAKHLGNRRQPQLTRLSGRRRLERLSRLSGARRRMLYGAGGLAVAVTLTVVAVTQGLAAGGSGDDGGLSADAARAAATFVKARSVGWPALRNHWFTEIGAC